VQSQTISVDRNMKRNNVPCIAFVNKLDRTGANPYKVKDQLIEKLGHNAVLTQLPIGLEDKFEGIIDLIEMKAIYYDGVKGTELRIEEIPESKADEAYDLREVLIEKASMFYDELVEEFLDGEVKIESLKIGIRNGVLCRGLTPVFVGSAYKNRGIQTLLDAVISFLPAPEDRENFAFDLSPDSNSYQRSSKNTSEAVVKLTSDSNMPTVALAFKLDNGVYGQLTYVRIYQGKIKKGHDLYNSTAMKRFKVGRLIRMHADSMEDIEEGLAGDIIALFGVDCSLGDTFVSG